MTIYLPIGVIIVFISLYLFRENNRVRKAKREERRDYINERRQELLDNVIKLKKNRDKETDH